MVTVTALGHATVLLDVEGTRVITDPVLGKRVGPGARGIAVGPRRRQPPSLSVDQVGALDAVLLSHSHWDHTDAWTLGRLDAGAHAIVQRRNRDLVKRFRESSALGWGEATEVEGGGPTVRVTSVRARHWGARVVVDAWRGFGGFLLEVEEVPSPSRPGRPLSILFAGDTARTKAYADLREARGGEGVDLAIMPIGAYDPWIMNHCSPEQAWEMAVEDLGAERVLPIHYDTFRLSREPLGEPLARLRAKAEEAGESDRLTGTAYGEVVRVA